MRAYEVIAGTARRPLGWVDVVLAPTDYRPYPSSPVVFFRRISVPAEVGEAMRGGASYRQAVRS